MVTHPFPALQPERPGELARMLFLDVWSGDSIKAVSSGLLLPIVPLPLSVKILGERVLAPRFPIYSQMSISPSAAANGKGYWNTKSKEKENKTLISLDNEIIYWVWNGLVCKCHMKKKSIRTSLKLWIFQVLLIAKGRVERPCPCGSCTLLWGPLICSCHLILGWYVSNILFETYM